MHLQQHLQFPGFFGGRNDSEIGVTDAGLWHNIYYFSLYTMESQIVN